MVNTSSKMVYDLIIIGAGPAGITAAVYAARKKLKTLVLTKDIGGQAAWSSDIGNYTGFQFITGPELAKKFEDHLKSFVIDVKENIEVLCVKKKGNYFYVSTPSEEFIAKTAIIASGRIPRMLGISGEKEFKNKGVTYCATCDAPIFAGKDVAVVGGGNSALDAVLQLIPIANKIYLINKDNILSGDSVMIEKVNISKKVIVFNNSICKQIIGEKFVTSLKIMKDMKEEISLNVGGIFIEIGSIPVSSVAECEMVKLNEYNEIIVNERCETNIPGFYAAGDVTNVPEKQIIVAAGQGCIAALSAFKHISTNKFE